MTGWWESTKHEWRTMPWTPRARRIGNALQYTVAGVALFSPLWVEGAVRLVLGP